MARGDQASLFAQNSARALNWHDFEVDQVTPTFDPGVEGRTIRCSHNLETDGAGGIHPACVIGDRLGQHPALAPETLANRLGIAILEAFDDYKKHAESVTLLALAHDRGLIYHAGDRWGGDPLLPTR